MSINTPPHIHEQVICANVFIRKGDQYLVLKRSPLKKYAPGVTHSIGGKVDPNENPFIAAKREVLEETGLKVKNMKLEAIFHEIKPIVDEPYNWLIFYFSADYDSGEVVPTDEGELIWLTREQFADQPMFPSLKLAVSDILDPAKGTMFATFEFDDKKQKVINSAINYCSV